MATVQDIPDESTFTSTISALPASTLAVIYFHAPWAAPCKQMSLVLSTLASTYPASAPIKFFSLDAEELPEVSEEYDVTAVPYIVLQRDGNRLETVSGGDAAKVRAAVERHANIGTKAELPPAQVVTPRAQDDVTSTDAAQAPSTAAHDHNNHDHGNADPEPETSKEELFKRLGELVKAAPVMLFMKGTPSAPQCGFSRQTVALLRERGIRYGFFNILADDEVRTGLKEFADWPTFPQLWVGGELVGGLDIVREEFENDEDFLKEYSVNSQS
jgi:Grx4 family monothiol glutaredoxin